MLRIQKLTILGLRLGIDFTHLISVAARARNLYGEYSIPKKNGGFRIIYPPAAELKTIQRRILDRLLAKIPISPAAFGWIKRRSRVSCAAGHVKKNMVYTSDISDFFPSIHYKRIYRLYADHLGCSPDVARLLTLLTTYKWCLPQGAPTSPIITNIILKPLDDELYNYWQRLGGHYSRFGDDIIVSSNKKLLRFKDIITGKLSKFGLKVNCKKFNNMAKQGRQEVLGLMVNEKVNISRKEIQELKNILHKAQTTGLEAQNIEKRPNFVSHLAGRIVQVKALNVKVGEKIWDNFLVLTNHSFSFS